MPTVREFRTIKMKISEHYTSDHSIGVYVNEYKHAEVSTSTFQTEIKSVSKIDEDTLLIGYYITYNNDID